MPHRLSWPKLNLSLLSNLIALVVIAAGFASHNAHVESVGLYAFSGALTNWVAIYMLFERVPGIYGSGVVVLQFEAFKRSIKNMLMEQFFNPVYVEAFFIDNVNAELDHLDVQPLLDAVDHDLIFDRLVEAIMASSFGSMLGMFGGAESLETLRAPCAEKIALVLAEMAASDRFKSALHQQAHAMKPAGLLSKVEAMIDQRLAELTPQMVKLMIKKIINEHLGWLVLWGAVFGGLLGGLLSFFTD